MVSSTRIVQHTMLATRQGEETMKIKVTEVDNNTTIKLKDDEGETVCYIHYNKGMNVVEIKNANKKPIKYIPLGEWNDW